MVPPPIVTPAGTLVRLIPGPVPLAETLGKFRVPATLLSKRAVPEAVETDVWLTSTPVRPPVPVMPWVSPLVEIVTPRTTALFARATVPGTVAVPVPIVGRTIVPLGGVMLMRASNVLVGEFVAPWPTSHSLVLSETPVVPVEAVTL